MSGPQDNRPPNQPPQPPRPPRRAVRPELREWVDRLVAAAPPLSDRQITLLRQLMPPVDPRKRMAVSR